MSRAEGRDEFAEAQAMVDSIKRDIAALRRAWATGNRRRVQAMVRQARRSERGR